MQNCYNIRAFQLILKKTSEACNKSVMRTPHAIKGSTKGLVFV